MVLVIGSNSIMFPTSQLTRDRGSLKKSVKFFTVKKIGPSNESPVKAKKTDILCLVFLKSISTYTIASNIDSLQKKFLSLLDRSYRNTTRFHWLIYKIENKFRNISSRN